MGTTSWSGRGLPGRVQRLSSPTRPSVGSAGRVRLPRRPLVVQYCGGMQRGPSSAVDVITSMLREDILARQDGEWLGSEDDVLARLGVSRPTLRQAARLLEAEELLVVKRGPNGGLFSRRPTSDAVAHMASVVLRSERIPVIDVVRTWHLIAEESARRAALHPSEKRRAQLLAYVAELRATTPAEDRVATLEAHQRFDERVGDLAGSPTLILFGRVLSTLVRETGLATLRPQKDPTTWASHMESVARAIRSGESAKAARLARKHGELMIPWAEELPKKFV